MATLVAGITDVAPLVFGAVSVFTPVSAFPPVLMVVTIVTTDGDAVEPEITDWTPPLAPPVGTMMVVAGAVEPGTVDKMVDVTAVEAGATAVFPF